MSAVVEEKLRTQTAGYMRLRQLANADLQDCSVNGAQRLCLLVDPSQPTITGKDGVVGLPQAFGKRYSEITHQKF